MRTIKPGVLTALNAPFQSEGRHRLVLVVGVMVSLDGQLLEPEQTLWKSVAALPGSRGFLDELKPKIRGEALMSGFAFAPDQAPAPAVAVQLNVGSIAKDVWAIGDRFWEMTGPTDAVAFDAMPLTYDRAFGGEGFVDNPTGRGVAPVKTDARQTVHPLPNLEYANKRVSSPRDRPPVAGFSPVDPALPQRMKKLGTYDGKWLETRYPEMAADFDPTYFNVAPEDQWIDGYWQGGEPFLLQNVHRDRAKLEGCVPSFRARVLATRKGAEEGALEDIRLRCDTLWFLPNDERLIMLFRGGIDVTDEEASDLVDVIVALERAGEPRTVDYYREIRRKRLDKNMGALHALRDRDLIPSDVRLGQSRASGDMEQILKRERLANANLRRRAARELESARQRVRAEGVDPDNHLPKELPPEPQVPEAEDLPAHVEAQQVELDAARAEAEQRKEKAFQDLREQCQKLGVDFDKQMAAAQVGGPPKVDAEVQHARMKKELAKARALGAKVPEAVEKKIDDPAFLELLRKAESAALDGYRRAAHFMPPAATMGEPEAAAMRRQIEAVLVADHSLVDRDLTGADLSGLDFSGRDLSGAMLERANLSGCSFRGANVSRAVFTRANLTDADFDGATAARTNFGGANLTRAKLTGADLTEAVLMNAKLCETDLTGAKIHQTQSYEIVCDRTILANTHIDGLVLVKGDLRGVDLRGARIERASLIEVDLSGADLSDASMFRTSLIDVTIEDARMRGIKLERVAFAKADKGSSLARSDLRGADLRRINFRGVDLEDVDLREANLCDADFSNANLSGAKLEGARAVRARFVGTNLTGADLSRTDLMNARMGRSVVRGASLEDANLFRADADRMQGDDKTSFKGANLKQVRITPATKTKPKAPAPTVERK